MLGMLKRLLMPKIKATCPCCGSDKVSSSLKKPIPFAKDGATYLEHRCSKCGHKWRMLVRAGI